MTLCDRLFPASSGMRNHMKRKTPSWRLDCSTEAERNSDHVLAACFEHVDLVSRRGRRCVRTLTPVSQVLERILIVVAFDGCVGACRHLQVADNTLPHSLSSCMCEGPVDAFALSLLCFGGAGGGTAAGASPMAGSVTSWVMRQREALAALAEPARPQAQRVSVTKQAASCPRTHGG